ncbi:unnamed protein product [Symbiodinium sp. CCMP2456]|nr:unnamed protein product [Symbiodinium sp. CCMP2456]
MQPAHPGRRNVATGTSVAAASAEANSVSSMLSTFEVAMLESTEPWEAQARRVPRRPGSKQEIQLERMLGGGDFDFGEFKSRSRKAQAPLLASSIPRDPVPAVLEAVVKFKQEASACVQKYLAERALPAPQPKEAPGPSGALSSRPSTRSIPREEPAGVAVPGSAGVPSGSREDQEASEPGVDDKVDEVTRHLLQAREKIEAVEREFAQIMGELAAYGRQATLPSHSVRKCQSFPGSGDAGGGGGGGGDASGGASF